MTLCLRFATKNLRRAALLLGLLLAAAPAQAQHENPRGDLEAVRPDTARPVDLTVLKERLRARAGSLGTDEEPAVALTELRAYRRRLRAVGGRPASERPAATDTMLARLTPLLPEKLKQAVLAKGAWGSGTLSAWRFAEGAGEKLLAWWRSKDPLPATAKNERLAEHLKRVAHALKNYSYDGSRSGYDARGRAYVRYGAPRFIERLGWQETGEVLWRRGRIVTTSTLREALMEVVAVSAMDFPTDNEIWFYDQIDEDAYYIFVESSDRGGPYRIGKINDLIPDPLVNANVRGGSERSRELAVAAYHTRRSIYRQLASYNHDFSVRYTSMTQVAGSASASKRSLGQFVVWREMRDDTRDWQARRRRREVMPNERSSFFDRVDSLDMAYHVARFLQPNGKTRAEVYFAARAGALAFGEKAQSSLARLGYPAPRRYLVSGFGRAYGRRFQSDTARVARRLLGEVAPDRAGPVQSVALAELSGLFHLGLQFQQRVVEEVSGDSVVTTGPRVRLSTERVDSLSALPSSAGGLAMSDLRPMVLPRRLVGELPVGGLALRKATRQLAYPFEKILPSVPLALYFEAYHLNLGNGDQTRYTVEYEIFRRTEASGLRGLFGGEEQQRTTTETTYNGTSRTAREMILIDLADVKELEPGSELAVTVRVTDEVTGETKERRVAFTVAEPPPEG